MNPLQESKQELNAAIRYAENAISSAKQTMESMNTYQEQTGREQALEAEVAELRDIIDRMSDDATGSSVTIKQLHKEVEFYTKKYNELVQQKEASSGPCGCQAYRDLEEKVGDLESEVNALEQPERPTMPVIPKAVAIAIFREGVQHGLESACTELEGQTITVEESEYYGHFEVSFTKEIDLDDELNLDWMRGKLGRYDEGFVTDALSNLCADKEFECRIHGVDDKEEKKND